MNNKIQLITPKLYEDICEKRALLESDARFCLRKRAILENALDEMGDVESWWVEHPDLSAKILSIEDPYEREQEIERLSSDGIGQVNEAWGNLQGFDFTEGVPLEAIIQTGYIVDPNNVPKDGAESPFRTKGAFNGLSVAGSNAESISRDIEKTLGVVNGGVLNDLEQAAYLHLNLARIQPFQDGNKRTARLLQRKMLYDAQFPQFPLLSGERNFYVNLMNDALQAQLPLDHKLLDSYESHGSNSAAYAREAKGAFTSALKGDRLLTCRRFFDFMASKVNSAQDIYIRDYL